ncbi:MAG: DNA mismatch repair endonuclease MutL [Candidatus Gastranaerophilales bacterium]|nr:DNA mismatch repair endonuclease MutL [Candidatus Gastranaerophilales bacterium]
MGRIKQLSVNLINQIAAGEVIERPASVVKELVENSIDAGATKVEISISNECRNIRIADNGCGIHPDDIELAFTKHATSKLSDENSLFNIQTLGFRGEALASIISIAKVTCTTRTSEFDYGTKVESQNSVVKSSKIGCAQGTIMEVNDLFFNQPARLKFLKSSKTEFAYIQELIQSLAISHPEVAFILKNNNSPVITTTQNADLLTRITEIYPSNILDELKEVKKTDVLSGIAISGFVSVPSYTRSSKKSIYTFVNSRTVKCPILMKAIDVAYKNMMPSGRYPFVVINIDINPEDVDVNAHPTKREIRYKNPNQIFNFVQSAVGYALSMTKLEEPTFVQKQDNVLPFIKSNTEDIEIKEDEEQDEVFAFPLNTVKKQEERLSFEPIETKQTKIDIEFDTTSKLKQINVIGQFKNTYILVENDDNLEIIDQHIAEERYIYEKLKSQKEVASQLLIISDVLDVEPEEVEILESAKPQLARFGYQVEKISDTQVIFKKIPQVLSNAKPKDILSELLENLKDSPENDLDTIEERILITTSCKAAIKAGDKLTLWQMEEIVKKLRTTKNPYTCPHGRSISHFVSHKEIASFFARNV